MSFNDYYTDYDQWGIGEPGEVNSTSSFSYLNTQLTAEGQINALNSLITVEGIDKLGSLLNLTTQHFEGLVDLGSLGVITGSNYFFGYEPFGAFTIVTGNVQ